MLVCLLVVFCFVLCDLRVYGSMECDKVSGGREYLGGLDGWIA